MNHPSFAAELGYAVARRRTDLTHADIAILARYHDESEAVAKAREVRRSLAAWTHIRKALRLRIFEQTTAHLAARVPRNRILAEAHDINQTQVLSEEEVTQTVEQAEEDHSANVAQRGRWAKRGAYHGRRR